MDLKEDGYVQEKLQASSYQVIQKISEGAVKVASEAIQSVYTGSPKLPPLGSGHRRSRSEVVPSVKRTNSFQKWKSQVQRALKWGNNAQEESRCSVFNPEILANQKRQWYQLHSKASDQTKFKEATSLFEHFIIVGLHPYANLEAVEDAYAKRKKWELQMEKSEVIDFRTLQCSGPSLPKLEPQILFNYPPGKRLAMQPVDLAAFCFPEGVKARVMERTPSLSELNELIYGQEHLSKDDLSFIFSLKVADNATIYGVCLLVQEFVQRPPAILGASSPLSQSFGGCSRFLVSAPRCYCILTRVPFFDLHYEMLNSIIAQERLNRITQFVSEMSLADYVPSVSILDEQMNENIDSPNRECNTDWMAYAIPVDSAIALTAAAAGIISDEEVPSSSSRCEPHSPESTASEVSDHSQTREMFKDRKKNLHFRDDYTLEASKTPDNGTCACPRSHTMERLGSSESLLSSVRSMGSEDEDDDIYFSHEKFARDEMIMEWARDNNNDLLQIVCSYHAMDLPKRGSGIVFKPLEHLQAVEYRRPPISVLGQTEKQINRNMRDSLATAEVYMQLAAAEEAIALSIWTTATICRVLSLENVLTLVTGVLLEKQVAIVCPNLSLFLPILPGKMLDFLDAPVPFVVGIQEKPTDLKMKVSTLVHVNVVKDQVKSCKLPSLPRYKELVSKLGPFHDRLSHEKTIAKRHPVYKCNELQAEAARCFLTIMMDYLESLCSDLRSHTITSVQSNDDRVSLLLKDSFIDSFPSKDQPFIKQFVDTQLFTVLSDSRISTYENGYH